MSSYAEEWTFNYVLISCGDITRYGIKNLSFAIDLIFYARNNAVSQFVRKEAYIVPLKKSVIALFV